MSPPKKPWDADDTPAPMQPPDPGILAAIGMVNRVAGIEGKLAVVETTVNLTLDSVAKDVSAVRAKLDKTYDRIGEMQTKAACADNHPKQKPAGEQFWTWMQRGLVAVAVAVAVAGIVTAWTSTRSSAASNTEAIRELTKRVTAPAIQVPAPPIVVEHRYPQTPDAGVRKRRR